MWKARILHKHAVRYRHMGVFHGIFLAETLMLFQSERSDYSHPKRYDVKKCALSVVYWVNQKYKDRNSIDASADIHNAIHQLMGVFCDRLKLDSTASPNCQTEQNKGRYREKELSFQLVSLLPSNKFVSAKFRDPLRNDYTPLRSTSTATGDLFGLEWKKQRDCY